MSLKQKLTAAWARVGPHYRRNKNLVNTILTPLILSILPIALQTREIFCAYVILIMSVFWVSQTSIYFLHGFISTIKTGTTMYPDRTHQLDACIHVSDVRNHESQGYLAVLFCCKALQSFIMFSLSLFTHRTMSCLYLQVCMKIETK